MPVDRQDRRVPPGSTTVVRPVTDRGQAQGWTVDRLCDDARQHAGLTLATCPRAELVAPPRPDPFRR